MTEHCPEIETIRKLVVEFTDSFPSLAFALDMNFEIFKDGVLKRNPQAGVLKTGLRTERSDCLPCPAPDGFSTEWGERCW